MQKNQQYFRFIGWFFLFNAILYLLFGLSYFDTIIHSTTLFKNLAFEYSTWLGKILVVAFVVTTYFSYMVFLGFSPAFLVFFFAFFVKNKKIITSLAICVAYLSIFFIVVDSRLYVMFKFHLNSTLLQMIFSPGVFDLLDLSSKEILTLALISLLILMGLVFFAFIVWKVILPKRLLLGKNIALIWCGATLFSYFSLMLVTLTQYNNLLIQQAANLPYYNNLLALVIPQKNAKDLLNRYSEGSYMQTQFAHAPLNYPKKIMQCSQKQKNHYNIIMIMVDSLRQDSIKYMPNTAKFAKQSWNFARHYSGGNSTQSGLFTLFYSIPSNYWTAALEQKVGPVFINQLLAKGYNTKIIWSSEMYNPPMYKTIYSQLPNLNIEKADSQNLSDRDKITTNKAITFLLESKAKNQPFFLNIFYNAPHAFCRSQDFPKKYLPISKECSRISMTNSSDPRPFYNSYLNSVDFIDIEIKKILDVIAGESLLDNSIVIITSDHGQEFNENHLNYWGHASNYSTYQVQVPLIIHWPGSNSKQFTHLTTHYDLMPTLLSKIFNCTNSFLDYSIGYDLLDENHQIPFVLVGSYVNTGIIEKDRLTTLHVSGEISVTDLNLQPLFSLQPRKEVLSKAMRLMRYYYKNN